MLTARRMRERMAEQAAGLPPPEPPRAESIPTHEHDRIVTELERKHLAEVNALRAELARQKAEPAQRKPAPEAKPDHDPAPVKPAPEHRPDEPTEPRGRRRS